MKKEDFLKLSNVEKAKMCQLILIGKEKYEEEKELNTEETRAKSFEEINIKEKQKQVLECLGEREMTAREVANEMKKRGFSTSNERNEAAPRLTELFQNRLVCIVAKKIDVETGKSVVVYKKVGDINAK